MGHPKKQRRKYSRPIALWARDRLEGDAKLVSAYGLKNNKELWKVKSEIARIRGLARKLLAKPNERSTNQLLQKLVRIGLLDESDKLEDVLKLTTEDLLERRLQTQVYRKTLSSSIGQARQLILHGHITVAGKRMRTPGHILTRAEETSISYSTDSPLAGEEHPARQAMKAKADKAAELAKKEAEKKEPKIKPPKKIAKLGEVKDILPEITGEELVAEASGDFEEETAEEAAEELPEAPAEDIGNEAKDS